MHWLLRSMLIVSLSSSMQLYVLILLLLRFIHYLIIIFFLNAFMLLILIIIYSHYHFYFNKYSHCIIILLLWIKKILYSLWRIRILDKSAFLNYFFNVWSFSTDVTVDFTLWLPGVFFYKFFFTFIIDLIFQ